ncbi:MAG: 50S ribosomal protein L25 [Planctomycetaceae bacterium]|nr:50S ribosomal protein L25 [bacterium]MDC0273332.1 50S ribosomal protein L25 [Planctomycetaceae bacterium]MDC0308476.1 50S ribosomal protein L25 [Planctomycetaceae bacterium]MDG2391846.1 50S ribosomal protein L25 [Planctomycetaceae bacterium]
MSEATILSAAKRERLGTAECRRLRREGMVPGNLYGHGEGAVSFKIGHDDVFQMVSDGHIAIDLDIDGKVDKAVFKEVQWDTFGRHIVHVDLIRVDPNEKVEVEVPVEIKGDAPGVENGGILDTQMHTLLVKCPVFKIPSSIVIRIGTLGLGEAIRIEDLVLDPDIEPQARPDEVIVQVVEPRKAAEPEGEEAEAVDATGDEGDKKEASGEE